MVSPYEEAHHAHALRYAVGLSPRPGKYKPDGLFASGVLVKWRKRTFVITAAHFLDTIPPEQMSIMYAPECGFRRIDATHADLKQALKVFRGPPDASSSDLTVLDVKRCRNPIHDVAALEIEPGGVPRWCECYDLPDADIAVPPPGDPVILLGLPVAASAFSRDLKGSISQHCLYVPMILAVKQEDRPNEWTDAFSNEPTFDPQIHFAIDFDRDKAEFSPEGMSGCAVWTPPAPTGPQPRIWHSRLTLAGIQVSWLKSHNALKATRTNVVVDLLQDGRRGP